jgi:site-specific DNA-methyltransferase (adenine-specific)
MTTEVLTGEIVQQRTPEQWAAVVRSDLGQAVAGFIAAGQHLTEARRAIPHGRWEPWCKDRVGISPETARRLMIVAAHPALSNPNHGLDLPHSWQTLYELSQLDPPLLEAAITAGKVHPELERKQARALVIEYKQKAASVRFDLHHGDFHVLDPDDPDSQDGLEAGSVDAIITDPPYPAEFLPLFGRRPISRDEYGDPIYSPMDEEGLSEVAARLLKPGGVCAVMVGQSYLPEVVERLSQRLDYHWTIAYLTPGGQAVQIFPRKVNTFWKPVLVFRNGDGNGGGEWFGDVAKSDVNDNDKRYHHWGQSESGMADLVKRLTRPGDTVVDPFMGAGTTGVAALALGRSFIGCDVNADHVSDARERLEQTVLERLGV